MDFAARCLFILTVVTLGACGSDRQGSGTRSTGGCVRDSLLPCQCTGGEEGLATCDGVRYGTCVCDGTVDGGTTDAGQMMADTGVLDTGVLDTGVVDTGVVDTGVRDTGVVDTGVVDTGVVDTGVRDTGVRDTGVRDTGVRDTGVRDTGVRDTGTPTPDAGPIPCSDDSQCTPLLTICENNQCVPGCFSAEPGALVCPNGDCNPLTGRCGGALICFTDTDCNPPISVCTFPICVPGCAQAAAPACPSGTSCDTATGQCL